MHLLASCNVEQSKSFSGTLVLPNEDKKTPDKVSLNIVVEDGNTEVFKVLDKGNEFVTFVEAPTTFCPTSFKGRVFNQYSLNQLEGGLVKPVNDVIDLVKLPEGYCDMLRLKNLTEEMPDIRFIGGKLLGVEGVNIGRTDAGKDKMSPVFIDFYDTFLEVDLNDLSGIQEKVKKTRTKIEGVAKTKVAKGKKKSSGEKAERKVPKRVVAFNNLFSNSEEEF